VAGVLYPAFGLLLSPIFAGAAMALSSVLRACFWSSDFSRYRGYSILMH